MRVRLLGLLALCAGCSPILDWREVRPEGTSVVAQFPCRPDRHARSVDVAGAVVEMRLLVCSAGDTTYALGYFDVGDPARVGAALAALQRSALTNVRATAPHGAPLAIKGMTPNAEARLLDFSGRLPDGRAIEQRAAWFVKGLTVHQAQVFGAHLAPDATNPFFEGLGFAS